MLSKHVCSALVASVTVVLHGCGGDGPAPSPHPAPSPVPSPAPAPAPAPAPITTTTTPFPTLPPCDPCTAPWDPETAVENLNSMYMDFNETNDTSRMGVTISMASVTSSFNANVFCSPVMGTSCFQGAADCRMSASLFNHKVIVNSNRVAPTMDREVGYVFDQALTENFWGKCAYIWDGANFNSLNSGCGGGATGNADCGNRDCCADHNSAFYNQCGNTEKHDCTRDDIEVSSRLCKGESYGVVDPPAQPTGATCFYEMPALIYGDSSTTNHLRDSVKQRVALQGNTTWMTGQWNEVVIDGRLLIQKIQSDPAGAIRAFVCVPSDRHPLACDMAKAMRDEFLTAYGVTGSIPVLRLDTTADFTKTGGPFSLPDSQIIAREEREDDDDGGDFGEIIA